MRKSKGVRVRAREREGGGGGERGRVGRNDRECG